MRRLKVIVVVSIACLVDPGYGQGRDPVVAPIDTGPRVERVPRQVLDAMPRVDLVIGSIEWVGRDYPLKERGRAPDPALLDIARLRVTVRNAGSKLWRSSGRVVAVVQPGTPEELDTGLREETRRALLAMSQAAREDKTLRALPLVTAPFSGQAAMPESLAPGESRTLEIPLGARSGQRNPAAKLLMAVDKPYTARVDLQVSGDDDPKNNGADLIFRIDPRAGVIGPMFRPRSTDPAARGSIEVVAPKR